jgi:hypothetical protein
MVVQLSCVQLRSLFSGMIPICSFYSPEVQCYMMLAYGVSLSVEKPGGLERALSGGGVVCTAATCSGTCTTAEGVVCLLTL